MTKKSDLSRNDNASYRNLANTAISRYLFWYTNCNVYFRKLCINISWKLLTLGEYNSIT